MSLQGTISNKKIINEYRVVCKQSTGTLISRKGLNYFVNNGDNGRLGGVYMKRRYLFIEYPFLYEI